jgi:Ca-activated chloride channel homolog
VRTEQHILLADHWFLLGFMSFIRLARVFSFLMFFALYLAFAGPATCQPSPAEGIQIALPASGRVHVENQIGAVNAEVWPENYVRVTVALSRDVAFNRSPLVIENSRDLLSISIERTSLDPGVTVELSVKLPARARTDLVTISGAISISGIPVSASVKSISGDIVARLSEPLNADIQVSTLDGVIRSELAAPLSAGGHLLETRVGRAERQLKINTETGQVTLTLASRARLATDHAAGLSPQLIGAEPAVAGAGTPARKSGPEEVNEGDVLRVDSQLVMLNLTVVDRETSRGILDLTRSDFRLFEDGAEQQILQFESSSAPFDLMLLIDLSGSTREVVSLIRAAALRFVDAARPSDRIGVIVFAGEPALISGLTLDRELTRARIRAIETAHGDTKLYDALSFTLDHLARDTRNSRRTAIVVMSDGLDGTIPGVYGQQGSSIRYRELLDRVREFDGVIYTLWLNTEYEALSPQDTQPEAFDMGHDRLKEMAELGGGAFYEVERLESLAGAYERVVADLGTVYSLAYRPANSVRDGKWRAIRVNVNRAGAVAKGKRGYYAN